MELAKMSQKIDIIKVLEKPDGFGGFKICTEKESTVWANVLPFKMVENTSLSRLDKKITTKFTVRRNSKITPHHKIIWQEKVYEIARIRTKSSDEDFMEICGFIK